MPLPTLTNEQWVELSVRLTRYADGKMPRVYWHGARPKRNDRAMGGVSAEDVAQEAILSVVEGRREWPEDVEPMPFFRGVVDSLVSHLAEKAENRLRSSASCATDGDESSHDPPAEGDLEPLEIVVEQEEADQFRALVAKVAEREPLASGMLDCAIAGLSKPCEMAELLETPVSEIYRVKKRLKGQIDTAQRKHRNKRPQS